MREPEEAASANNYSFDDAPAREPRALADGAMYYDAMSFEKPLPPQAAPAPAPVPQTARSSAPLHPPLIRRFFPENWPWHTCSSRVRIPFSCTVEPFTCDAATETEKEGLPVPSFFRLSVAVAVAESSGYFRFRERSFYF